MAKATETKKAAAPKADADSPGKAPKNVHEAILEVMRRVPYIQKTGKVGSGSYGYTFASEKDFIGKLHPVMVDLGLTLVPVDGEQVASESYPSDKGKMMSRARFKMTYSMTHAPSGTSTPVVAFGEGCDMGDKCASKAMTIAQKYALKQVFMIETGNDPDTAASSEYARDEAQPEAPPQEATQPTRTSVEELFGKAVDAVRRAPDLELLTRYRGHFGDRGFSPDQVKQLHREFDARRKALEAQAVPAANGEAEETPVDDDECPV